MEDITVAAHAHNFKDLTGQKLGAATVLRYAGKNKHDQTMWLCRCECGNEWEVVSFALLRPGGNKSCGCQRGNPLPEGEAAFHSLLWQYRKGAADRGLVWGLSDELFGELTKQSCYYCGIAPSQIHGGEDYRGLNGGYVYNGIDRLDNGLGYLPDNCVSCCWECNVAKGTKSYEQFMEWIARVIHFQEGT